MTGQDVREVYEAALPDEVLLSLIEASGFQQRQRRLQGLEFIRAAVISAATGQGGRQADLLRVYFENGAPEVARGAAYAWFNKGFESVMEGVRDLTLAYAQTLPLDLPGILGAHVRDWHIVDSMTVKIDDALIEEYPGTGEYAALKVHKRFSVGLGTTWDYHLSPAREHDAGHLSLDESWRGLGLLVDLGYASHDLLRKCEQFDVRLVVRLKENWKPKVTKIHQGEMLGGFLKGTDLDTLIDDGTLRLKGKAIDLDVQVGSGKQALNCRLVGVRGPKGWCWYLTNLDRTASPQQVYDLYRIRWEIEANNKLDKSCLRLDEITARTGHSVRALVHAALVSATLVCLIAHKHRLGEKGPRRKGTERKTPPIHPQMMARQIGHSAPRIAAALALTGKQADEQWNLIARVLEHQGRDPNWRRRPSVLDQLRGWRISPGRPRKERAASIVANVSSKPEKKASRTTK